MGLPARFEPGTKPSQLYEGIEYKDFWVEKSRVRLDELEHSIIRNLLPASGRRIIDIGCGFGRLADCYLDRFEQVVMLDGSMTLLRQGRESFGERATYIAADANHLPFRGSSFDCALMMRVFHHLPNSQLVSDGVNRILGKGGYFVFNYSNKLSARQLARKFVHLSKENPFSLEPMLSGKTLIQHHPTYVHRVLLQSGFSQMKYLGVGVLDKVPGKIGQFEGWKVLGRAFAPFFGVVKVTPWVICKTRTTGGDALEEGKSVDDLLVCPSCYDSVMRSSDAYLCKSCGQSYPIVDGIPDFRVGA
jgi:ubiquinone/menaquinone biosynthesis C-methylase UbiE